MPNSVIDMQSINQNVPFVSVVSRRFQRGIVAPLVVIGLLAILAVAGLAIDSSHALANKTRMQNAVDAAALAAAKVLDETEDTLQATAAAFSLLGINAAASGNHELGAAYSDGEISVNVQFSGTAVPFAPGSAPGPFVRVITTGFTTETTLSQVLGFTEIPTPASAVAGPSGPLGVGDGAQVCDVAPIAVCLDHEMNEHGKLVPIAPDPGELHVLKPDAGNHSDIGPGNYKMLRMGCTGGSCLRQNLAGDFEECVTIGTDAETEPGVSSGPTSQGFNTRFGMYQGGGLSAEDYPPDRIITELNPKLKNCSVTDDATGEVEEYIFQAGNGERCSDLIPDGAAPPYENQVEMADELDYSYHYFYKDHSKDNPELWEPGGVLDRRLLIFPTVECGGDETGQSSLTVTGSACFFMLQSIEGGQSEEAGAGNIFGEFVESCPINGTSGINPGGGPSPQLYKIVLYKNSDSTDS